MTGSSTSSFLLLWRKPQRPSAVFLKAGRPKFVTFFVRSSAVLLDDKVTEQKEADDWEKHAKLMSPPP